MKRTRILVVDDEREIRQLYRTALVLAGFSVDTAADGLTALRKVDEQRPDLIVLDLHLPRVDGVAVLGELRSNSDTWSIPVVVVTGAEYQFAIAQASAILRKPCEPDELISIIEKQLAAAA